MQRSRIFLVGAVVLGALIFIGSGLVAGYAIGRNDPQTINVQGISNTATPEDANADFGLFWQVWRLIDQKHLRATSTGPQERVYGAIKGLVGSLGDPYSEFFTPTSSTQFQQNIEGEFGGIGIEIGEKNGQIVVIAPIKDTPAAKAGLKAGDAIVQIDDKPTDDLAIEEAVAKIRGEIGTNVKLTVLREGEEKVRDFTLTRSKISVPTLDFSMKGNIAYVQLYEFTGTAGDLFRENVVKKLPANTKGMVLDLRDDPGGFLEVSVDIAGWFVDKDTLVVKEAGRDANNQEYLATGNGALKNLPVVILINKGSASAAEILAGSLRDNRGAKLVGETSFGKGTVQEITNLPGGGSVKLTVAHWVLPKGQILEGTGLKPDYEVKLPDNFKLGDADPQLQKALDLLK